MNQDLISRDAVLDACSQSINILDAMSRIEDLSSVTPKQRTGHWINTADPRYSDNIVCDLCGFDSMWEYDFCPKCGAKMEEQA